MADQDDSVKSGMTLFHGDIEKFDEWNFVMEGVLHGHGLLNKYEQAMTGQDVEWTADEQTKLNKVSSLVTRSLRENALAVAQTAGSHDLIEIMKAMAKEYNSDSKSSRLFWIRNLVTATKGPDEKMQTHVRRKNAIFRDRLNGRIEPNELKMMAIVCTLGSEYSSVVSDILSQTTTS